MCGTELSLVVREDEDRDGDGRRGTGTYRSDDGVWGREGAVFFACGGAPNGLPCDELSVDFFKGGFEGWVDEVLVPVRRQRNYSVKQGGGRDIGFGK